MKLHQLLISSLAVVCYTFPAVALTAETAAAPKVVVQKGDPKLNAQMAEIVRAEAELLKSSKVDRMALLKLYRSAVEKTLNVGSFKVVPSAETKGLFQSFAKKYPSSGIVNSLFAGSLIDVGQNSRAVTVFQQAIKTNPRHVLLYEQLASHQQERGQTQVAAATLESGIAAAPYNVEFYLDLAKLQPGKFAVALAQFDRALAALSDDPTVYEAFGALFVSDNSYADGDLKLLISRFEQGRDRHPKSAPIYLALSTIVATKQNRAEAAIEILEVGIAKGADAGIIYRYLGDSTLNSNRSVDKAIDYYQKSIASGGQFCDDGSSNRANALLERGKSKETIAILARSLERGTLTQQAECVELMWGIASNKTNLRSDLIPVISGYVERLMAQPKIDDEALLSTNILLKLLLEEKQFDRVISWGKKIVAKSAEPTESYITIGRAYQQNKQFTEAVKSFKAAEASFQKAIAANPAIKDSIGRPDLLSASRWHLGSLHQASGKNDLAMAEYELATQALPYVDEDANASYRAKAHNSIGEILLTQGKSKQAIAHFEAAVRESANYQPAKNNLDRAKVQGSKPRRYKYK